MGACGANGVFGMKEVFRVFGMKRVLGASWGVSGTKQCFGVKGVFGGRKGLLVGEKKCLGENSCVWG